MYNASLFLWHEVHIVQRTQFMDIQNTKFPRNDTDEQLEKIFYLCNIIVKKIFVCQWDINN